MGVGGVSSSFLREWSEEHCCWAEESRGLLGENPSSAEFVMNKGSKLIWGHHQIATLKSSPRD